MPNVLYFNSDRLFKYKIWGDFNEDFNKKSSVLTLFLSILFCLCLTGCADMLKKEDMDQTVERLIKALNEDDADQIYASMYPGVVTREQFDESYETVRQLWKKLTITRRS